MRKGKREEKVRIEWDVAWDMRKGEITHKKEGREMKDEVMTQHTFVDEGKR